MEECQKKTTDYNGYAMIIIVIFKCYFFREHIHIKNGVNTMIIFSFFGVHPLRMTTNYTMIDDDDNYCSVTSFRRIFIMLNSSGSRISDTSLYKCSLLMVSNAFAISSSKM